MIYIFNRYIKAVRVKGFRVNNIMGSGVEALQLVTIEAENGSLPMREEYNLGPKVMEYYSTSKILIFCEMFIWLIPSFTGITVLKLWGVMDCGLKRYRWY